MRFSTVAIALGVGVAATDPPTPAGDSIHSPYASEAPKIDGRISEKEWQQAERFLLPGRDTDDRCEVLVMNDEDNLYLGFSALDDRTNTTGSRGSGSTFDNVALWADAGVGYWLYGDGGLRTERLDSHAQTSTSFSSSADGSAMGPAREKYMSFELMVPLDELGIEAGKSIQVGLHYWDDYDHGPSFWWPPAADVFTPSSFGVLTTSKKP